VTSEPRLYVGLAMSPGAAPVPAGLLKIARRGNVESGEFAYGRRYLQNTGALPLNPDVLPLQDRPFVIPERRVRDGGALPLTFRDALPDAWGRKVLELQAGRSLSDTEALLLTNADRVGAMVFAESLPLAADAPPAELFDLETLADAARRVDHDLAIKPALQRVLQGGSLGGARPKATLIVEGQRWLAKFPARGDDHPVEIVEAATMDLAAVCGIDVPVHRLRPLSKGEALLMQRFDRDGPITDERRRHYLSASALLDVPYDSSGGSYVELAQALRRLSFRAEQDLLQLYRRMVFNLVVDNSDDHVKNHGVLHHGDGKWCLAPAFDLVMQMTHVGYQQLAILPGRMDSQLDLAREAAPQFGLSAQRAEDLIVQIGETVMTQAWLAFKACGAERSLLDRVRASLEKQAQRIGG
jgi:serine/threonine-protein kinase HipA